MDQQEQHEAGLARFIASDWRTRFRDSLDTRKSRTKLRAQLAHFRHLDARFTTLVPPAEQKAALIAQRLRAKGASDSCYLLSESDELDGKAMRLDDALETLVGKASSDATFVSCVAGELAYFHDEEPESRYLLERNPL